MVRGERLKQSKGRESTQFLKIEKATSQRHGPRTVHRTKKEGVIADVYNPTGLRETSNEKCAMRGWTLLLGVAVVVVCNLGLLVAVDGTSVLEHGWEVAMMDEKLAPLMKHAKEAIRDKVNEWLQERREQRAAREQHKAKLFAQRKMASSPEPSSIWMSLMSDVLANMTPSGMGCVCAFVPAC